MSPFAAPEQIWEMFSRAMSDMYRTEVPQYGRLCTLVAEVNVGGVAAAPGPGPSAAR